MIVNNDMVGVARTLPTMYGIGYTGRTTYDKLYRCVLEGTIPAEPAPPGMGSRLVIRRSDFPVVAAALGLTPPVALGAAPHIVAIERANA